MDSWSLTLLFAAYDIELVVRMRLAAQILPRLGTGIPEAKFASLCRIFRVFELRLIHHVRRVRVSVCRTARHNSLVEEHWSAGARRQPDVAQEAAELITIGLISLEVDGFGSANNFRGQRGCLGAVAFGFAVWTNGLRTVDSDQANQLDLAVDLDFNRVAIDDVDDLDRNTRRRFAKVGRRDGDVTWSGSIGWTGGRFFAP